MQQQNGGSVECVDNLMSKNLSLSRFISNETRDFVPSASASNVGLETKEVPGIAETGKSFTVYCDLSDSSFIQSTLPQRCPPSNTISIIENPIPKLLPSYSDETGIVFRNFQSGTRQSSDPMLASLNLFPQHNNGMMYENNTVMNHQPSFQENEKHRMTSQHQADLFLNVLDCEAEDYLEQALMNTHAILSDQEQITHDILTEQQQNTHAILTEEEKTNDMFTEQQQNTNDMFTEQQNTYAMFTEEQHSNHPILAEQEHTTHPILAEKEHTTHSILTEQEHTTHSILTEQEHTTHSILTEQEHTTHSILTEQEHTTHSILTEQEHTTHSILTEEMQHPEK
ncbi:uncharacterized protein LOC125179339 [Hyalella azteca]|uniref:Uncharacterized protein LOC125179339 n=1 Tax=Hyalella azteca TaxID=294128 RepID=A0A979FXR9_HYAAZ|nr:uncharacterized protein LOC125179339 [Hyalella azteca]